MSKYTPSQAFMQIAKIIDTANQLANQNVRDTTDDVGFDTLIEEHGEWMKQPSNVVQAVEPVNYQSCITIDVADELRELIAVNGFTPDYDSVFSQYLAGDKDAHQSLQDWFKLKSQFNPNIINPLYLLQNALTGTKIQTICRAILEAK